ncbi:MAG: ABC transporter permease [Promethearchaeota archaeon]
MRILKKSSCIKLKDFLLDVYYSILMKKIELKAMLYSLKWSMNRIWALFRNEIESLLKDKQSLLIVFLLPIALMVPFYRPPGEESSGDLLSFEKVEYVGVLDLDTTTDWPGEDLSENFTAIIGINSSYKVIMLTSFNDGLSRLRLGDISGFFVIPDKFEENITNHLLTTIKIVVDATDVETAAKVTATAEIVIALFKVTHGLLRDEIFPISFQQFKAQSPLFTSGPLIFSIMILGGAMLLTSQSIVGDEPLKRTLLTPAGKLEVIIAKTLAYSGIHAIQVQMMLFVAMTIFRLPVYCPFYVAFLILFLVAFCGIAIGMFISMISKTRLQANQFFLLVFILMLLSLLFIPNEDINHWMPMYQGIDGFTSVAYKGFTWVEEPWPFISLSILSASFIIGTIVVFYFKKTIE